MNPDPQTLELRDRCLMELWRLEQQVNRLMRLLDSEAAWDPPGQPIARATKTSFRLAIQEPIDTNDDEWFSPDQPCRLNLRRARQKTRKARQ